MAIPPPPPGFTIDGPPQASDQLGGRPVIRKGVEPAKPDLPTGYGMNGGTAAPIPGLPEAVTTPESYRPITPEERKAFGVDPQKPFVVNIKTGKPELIGQGAGTDAQTPANDPDRIFQNDALLKSIAHVRELAKHPLSLGTGSEYLRYIPIVGQNAADMHAALQQVQGDILRNVLAQAKQASPNGASGFGNLSNVEGENLKASIAKLSQAQSPEEFVQGLDQAEQFYRRALARSSGLDPMDPEVAKRLGITGVETAPGDEGAPTLSRDNGITASSPAPIVDADTGSVQSSTKTKTIIDPKKQALGNRIVGLVSQGADRNTVMGFAVGADPTLRSDPAFRAWVDKAIQYREQAKKAGVKAIRFGIDPGFYSTTVPLSEDGGDVPGMASEKDAAKLSASPAGATIAAAADTGTFGAMPDVVAAAKALGGGDYSGARQEFKDRQNLLAYENPGATLAGNLIGGASTLAAGAPASFPRLIASAGKQGGLYGFLSSEDPSLTGRAENGLSSGLVSAASAAALDPAMRGVGLVGRRSGNAVQRLLGTPAEDIADSNALASFAAHAPTQDVPAMRARATEQAGLGAEPSGLTALDRSGQDYLGRQVARSPNAREAADAAVTKAQERLPAQLENDFGQAIDDAAGGDKNVAAFLKRPAREITSDIQDMAGREFEHGIGPIRNQPVTVNDEIISVLTDEQAGPAIRDAMRQAGVSEETVNGLRALPRTLNQVSGMDPVLRDKVLASGGLELTVDQAHRIARGFDRMSNKLDAGSDLRVRLRELSRTLRDNVSAEYPEFQETNTRYASRRRAIEALDTARETFLGDTKGKSTDELARATSRMSDKPGEPEFGAADTGANGFQVSKPPQNLPSEKQMAIAGARESAVAKTAEGGGAGSVERLSTTGQQERNRMILGERAGRLEARSKAQASNVRTTERLSSGGTVDDAGGKIAASMKAVANLGFHRGGAAIASALSGIRGLGPDDAARVVKLYTDPSRAGDVIGALEKAYGRRKARFIIDRIAAIAVTANKTRTLPDEAVQQ